MSFKKSITILAVLATSIGFSQSDKAEKQSKFIETSIKVYGKCDMCETRIEKALDLKGIRVADWDIDSKMLKLVYKPSLITEDEIHAVMVGIGHDTDKSKATQEKYDALHHCCKYKRAE